MTFTPAFNALCREAAIAAEMVASGVTLLGKATGSTPGYFGQALFNLSIGFERFGKLTFIVKHHNDNAGAFPTDRELRQQFGHSIRKLYEYAVSLAPRYLDVSEDGSVPADSIHEGVVHTLTEFGESTRYYNLNVLSDPGTTQENPAKLWCERVSKPILDRHYREHAQREDEQLAELVGTELDRASKTIVTGMDGGPIDGTVNMFKDAAKARVIQRWSRLYVLHIARFWSGVLYGLEDEARAMGTEDIPFLSEFTVLFRNPDDKYLRDRKTWSIYRL